MSSGKRRTWAGYVGASSVEAFNAVLFADRRVAVIVAVSVAAVVAVAVPPSSFPLEQTAHVFFDRTERGGRRLGLRV
jgi:hypothetical protein